MTSRATTPDRRAVIVGALAGLAGLARPGAAAQTSAPVEAMMRGEGLDVLVPFTASPFPYDGEIPDRGGPFLDVGRDGRRGHTAPRHGVYWEDPTYSDRRVLLSIPKRIDWGRPVTSIVFFHGNQARLRRDVIERQGVPRQVHAAGLNAVLVAPQMAVDALDSSAGHFWEDGFFARFVAEAAARIGAIAGDRRAAGRVAEARVVVMAYSGGYLPTAFALERGGLGDRVCGLILLDGLYAEEDRIAAWIAGHPDATVFSAYSPSTRDPNLRLQRLLKARGVAFREGMPERLGAGSVSFLATPTSVSHDGFLTRAWTDQPIRAVLSRLGDHGR